MGVAGAARSRIFRAAFESSLRAMGESGLTLVFRVCDSGGLSSGSSAGYEHREPFFLRVPAADVGHRSELPFAEVADAFILREDDVLDLRRQQREFDHLRESGARDAELTGDLGVVSSSAIVDGLFDLVCQHK